MHLTESNFDDVVLTSNEIWFIEFTASWCNFCVQFKPKYEACAKELGSKARFGMIDADKNRGLAKKFNVQKIPTILYYGYGYGKTHSNINKYTGKKSIEGLIAQANELLY